MKNFERMDVDGALLRSFVAIAEAGSLTAAADRLNRTQSAVSVQLARLEAGLGAPVFRRTSKGMQLTEAGQRLLPKAWEVLAHLREVNSLFKEPLRGALHIGLPDDYENGRLERVLAQFAAAHPDVSLRATSGCTAGYRALIENQEMDIAICSEPEPGTGQPIGEAKTIWATAPNARFATDAALPIAVLDRGCWWSRMAETALTNVKRPYAIALRTQSFGGLQAAVRAGLAVATLPEESLGPSIRRAEAALELPELPTTHRAVVVGAHAPAETAEAMREAILNAHTSVAGPRS